VGGISRFFARDHLRSVTQLADNNVTHEYRINNMARNGASQFDGSINFMIGAVSRFYVGSNGNIGIGTTAPSSSLDVSNSLSSTPTTPATVNVTTFSNTASGSQLVGRKARGTAAAPLPVQNADTLALFGARGHGTTAFGTVAAGIGMSAAENWTDTAQGTVMHFVTTATGTTTPFIRMSLDPFGNLGIGTGAPAGVLEASRTGDAEILATSFGGGSGFRARLARGTAVAPTAVQAGDEIGAFTAAGYGATAFSDARAGMAAFAAENWTDAAQGSALVMSCLNRRSEGQVPAIRYHPRLSPSRSYLCRRGCRRRHAACQGRSAGRWHLPGCRCRHCPTAACPSTPSRTWTRAG
jgi:hypothetical protein